jgi:hypothetical protein
MVYSGPEPSITAGPQTYMARRPGRESCRQADLPAKGFNLSSRSEAIALHALTTVAAG